MNRPTEEIEKLRKAEASGNIKPEQEYRLDMGNGQVMAWTGAQLLETANAFVAFADAQKRGDKAAMLSAMKRIENA